MRQKLMTLSILRILEHLNNGNYFILWQNKIVSFKFQRPFQFFLSRVQHSNTHIHFYMSFFFQYTQQQCGANNSTIQTIYIINVKYESIKLFDEFFLNNNKIVGRLEAQEFFLSPFFIQYVCYIYKICVCSFGRTFQNSIELITTNYDSFTVENAFLRILSLSPSSLYSIAFALC